MGGTASPTALSPVAPWEPPRSTSDSNQRYYGEAPGRPAGRSGAGFGGTGGQRLGCLGRQAGLGWVAETRETGLSTRAGYAGGPEVSADTVPILPALYQPSRLPLGGGGCPWKPQAGLLEKESRLRMPRAGELSPGRDLYRWSRPARGRVAHLLHRQGRKVVACENTLF